MDFTYATIQTEMQKSGADLYLRDQLNCSIDVKGGHTNTRISNHACTFEVLIIKRFLSNVEKMGYTRISISWCEAPREISWPISV